MTIIKTLLVRIFYSCKIERKWSVAQTELIAQSKTLRTL